MNGTYRRWELLNLILGRITVNDRLSTLETFLKTKAIKSLKSLNSFQKWWVCLSKYNTRCVLHFDDLLNYMPHVLSCFTCLVNYVLSCSTCLVLCVLSWPKCPRTLVLYLLSCPTFSSPHTPRAQRVSCASCSCASHALSLAYSCIPMSHVSRALRFMRPHALRALFPYVPLVLRTYLWFFGGIYLS